jgi:hypothetical protein
VAKAVKAKRPATVISVPGVNWTVAEVRYFTKSSKRP